MVREPIADFHRDGALTAVSTAVTLGTTVHAPSAVCADARNPTVEWSISGFSYGRIIIFPVGTSPIFIVDGSSSRLRVRARYATGSVDVRIGQSAKSKPLQLKIHRLTTHCMSTTGDSMHWTRLSRFSDQRNSGNSYAYVSRVLLIIKTSRERRC